jgi:hypothetical protein
MPFIGRDALNPILGAPHHVFCYWAALYRSFRVTPLLACLLACMLRVHPFACPSASGQEYDERHPLRPPIPAPVRKERGVALCCPPDVGQLTLLTRLAFLQEQSWV